MMAVLCCLNVYLMKRAVEAERAALLPPALITSLSTVNLAGGLADVKICCLKTVNVCISIYIYISIYVYVYMYACVCMHICKNTQHIHVRY